MKNVNTDIISFHSYNKAFALAIALQNLIQNMTTNLEKQKVLLIGEDGANLVMRNLPLIYKAEGKFWVNNHAHILKPKKDDYDYLAHALEAANYRNYITGSAQPKLSQENLQAVKLPIPPLAEQQAIASYLDTKCHEIDSLISLKRQKIEMLKDYKKSIIFEAVTGKTDLESLALIGRNHWH